MWEVGAICLVALLVVWISHLFYSWTNPKCKNGKLPPGSMGLPFIGETLQFFSPYSSHDIPPFIKNRIARYGPLFRTSLVGQKIVVSTDNEINYSIFQQENKSFQLWYTDSFAELIGREKNVLAHDGRLHNYMKKLVLHFIGPAKLREKLLVDVDQTTRKHLQSWAEHGSVDFKQGASQVIFEFLARNLMSYNEKRDSKKVLENCKTFMDGLISFPLNIPGTAFHASLQGQELHKGSKTFMGFGCGVRLCVGAEFAKLQMATFLHYLVTKYRHGHLFRTSLIGQRVVVSTDPEINYKVLQQENESLVMWYTDCFLGIVGTEEDLMAIHGSTHKYLKNLMLQFLGPENVKVKLLPKVDEATRKHLHSWASNGSVDVKHGAAYV
ncbi:hypothetical protein LWI29_021599 [Acer saccharum]|uniref:Cytochrome P450 n=1 Tax=Acer saccharum TaxID=4024 RepID=A0AA39RX97_ACESA|nr:hypothetical protein LWI29_021599 [Acer saccharum]